MSDVKICNVGKITKLNQYFYITPEGDILKHKKYCVIQSCKKLASFNYHNKKELLYCNEHKLDSMINIRKGYILCEEHNISYSKDSSCKDVKNYIVYYVIKMLISRSTFLKNMLIILIEILL